MRIELAQVDEHFISEHIQRSVRLVGRDRVLDHIAGCPDGRNTISTWFDFGGDSARKLRKLIAYERIAGTKLNSPLVIHALAELSHNRPGVHVHMDDHLMHSLGDVVFRDEHFQRVAALEHAADYSRLEKFLIDPSAIGIVQMSRLAHLIAEQKDVGCGHWSMLLHKSDDMQVRPELARDVYVATMLSAWTHPLYSQLPVLHGDHDELAIVQVYSEDEGFVPLVQPNVNGTEVFVVTPQAIGHADELSFPNVTRVLGADLDKRRYLSALRDVSERQRSYTLAHLGAAKGKNVYRAEVNRRLDVSSSIVGVNSK